VTPVRFSEANGTLTGGPGHVFGLSQEVGDLPVYRDGVQVVSCWRPSLGERLRLLLGGRVWLLVATPVTHAPVCITAERPFVQEEPAP
jgi:hypothetical protein